MKKNIVLVITIILSIAVLSTTVFAGTDSKTIKYGGESSAPLFKLDDEYAYCVDAEATHPTTGIVYTSAKTYENDEIKSIFVNLYKEGAKVNDTIAKIVQQAIWQKLNPDVNYRVIVELFLGADSVELFDRLLAPVDTTGYEAVISLFVTEETDRSGHSLQRMITAKVSLSEPETIPEPTVPDPEPTKPEPTDPEPTKPEPTDPKPTVPEPTDPKPTVPEPTDPEPTKPEPTDPKPTVPEPTDPKPTVPEPTDPKPTVPEPDDPVLEHYKPNDIPQTGDAGTLVATLLFFTSAGCIFFVVKRKKNSEK